MYVKDPIIIKSRKKVLYNEYDVYVTCVYVDYIRS